MENLDIQAYIGKVTGDPLDASEWNEVFTKIMNKVNEIISVQRQEITGAHVEGETLCLTYEEPTV